MLSMRDIQVKRCIDHTKSVSYRNSESIYVMYCMLEGIPYRPGCRAQVCGDNFACRRVLEAFAMFNMPLPVVPE